MKKNKYSISFLHRLVFKVIIHVTLFLDCTRFCLKFSYLILKLKGRSVNPQDSSETYPGLNPEPNTERINSYPRYWNCDSDNPVVVQQNKILLGDINEPLICVDTILAYIHNAIKFTMVLPEPASLTIEKRRGTCFHMLTVSVALLRSAGIQARFHLVKVENVNFFERDINELKDRGEIIPCLIRESPYEWALGFFDGQKWKTRRIFSPSEMGVSNNIGITLNSNSINWNGIIAYKVIAASDSLPFILAYGFKILFLLYPELINNLNSLFNERSFVNPENRDNPSYKRMNTGNMNVDLSNPRDEVHFNK